MIWKKIPGFDNYDCSEKCNVRNVKRGNILTITYRTNDYPIVKMYDNTGKSRCVRVHRFYMALFKDNPNNYQFINHINGIKSDFRLENLEWCTHSQNIKHAYKTGLSTGRRSLDKLQVRVIKDCIANGIRNIDLSDYFRVHNSIISNIRRCKMYSLHG